MKIKVARDDLARLLDNAKALVERRGTMPVLQNVLLSAAGEELALRSTDLQVTYTGHCTAEVETDGELCLPAHKLAELVKLLPAEHAHLAATGLDLTLEAAQVRYNLHGLPPADFPAAPEDSAAPLYLEDGAALRRTLGRVAYAASTSEHHPSINGVYLELRPDGADWVLRLVATDGHRLALCDLELGSDQTPELAGGLLLPVKSAVAMHRVLGEGAVTLGLSQKLVTLDTNGDLLQALPQEKQFPDYTTVIPAAHPHRALAPRLALVEALKRVEAIEPGKSRAVNLTFAEGILEITAEADLGDAREHLEVEWSGGEVAIGLNPRYLLDACGCLEADEVILDLKDAANPVKVSSNAEADQGCLGVIMPISTTGGDK